MSKDSKNTNQAAIYEILATGFKNQNFVIFFERTKLISSCKGIFMKINSKNDLTLKELTDTTLSESFERLFYLTNDTGNFFNRKAYLSVWLSVN